jgi:hypothetical protein
MRHLKLTANNCKVSGCHNRQTIHGLYCLREETGRVNTAQKELSVS